jgi:hypothetical protein
MLQAQTSREHYKRACAVAMCVPEPCLGLGRGLYSSCHRRLCVVHAEVVQRRFRSTCFRWIQSLRVNCARSMRCRPNHTQARAEKTRERESWHASTRRRQGCQNFKPTQQHQFFVLRAVYDVPRTVAPLSRQKRDDQGAEPSVNRVPWSAAPFAMPPSAPEPIHILRTQTAQAAVLAFSPDNARLYAGDTTGRVVVTATRVLRPLAVWAAHDAGILGVEEWAEEESGWTVITFVCVPDVLRGVHG